MGIIEKHINTIKQLCDNHKVAELYVFGSVLTKSFNANSDIDLLVKFSKSPIQNYATNYFDLKEKLQQLFLREVDLVESEAIKNPYLIKSIEESKQRIYG